MKDLGLLQHYLGLQVETLPDIYFMHHENSRENYTNKFLAEDGFSDCRTSSTPLPTKNPVFHAKSKHIEILHHFILECVPEVEISLNYLST